MTLTTPEPTRLAPVAGATSIPELEELRRRVTGTLHCSLDPTWDVVRCPWALAVDQRPLAVLEVRDADDVQAAVRWAVDHDLPVSAQPVGHGATHDLEGVLLLRTRALDSIHVDVERRTATVGAGVKAGELLAALDGTGLTFLCGSNPDPSVVGMTLTGGISWFGRAYGLGADSIVAVDLIDGLGRARHVTPGNDPDLFWAVRGGGGDFGILTAMEVALHPAPGLYGGRLMWPVEQMGEVLRAFRETTATAPPELTMWYHTYRFPPLPEIPEPIRGRAFAGVALCHLGSPEDAEAAIGPLRAVPGLVMDLLGEVPLSRLGDVAAEPTEPMPSLEFSTLLTELPDELIDDLETIVGAGSDSPLAILQLRHFGGAFADATRSTSSHGHVPEEFSLFGMGVPAGPGSPAAIAATFDRLARACEGHGSGRALLNFLGADGDPDRWWSPGTRARLVEVKDAYDPLGTVRSNRPVRPVR